MAVYRSRVVREPLRIPNPQIERSIQQWEAKVSQAKELALAAGRKEEQSRIGAELAKAQTALAEAQRKAAADLAAQEKSFTERWGKVLAALAQAVDKVQVLESAALAAAEAEVVRLALAVAGRILHRELERGAWLEPILRDLLPEASERRGIIVRLHPDDHAEAQTHVEAAVAALGGTVAMPVLEADPTLARGSCLIECGGTIMDAGLPSNLERVAGRLLDEAAPRDWRQLFPLPAAGGDG